jgi:RHS repeat-associated protein
MLVSNKHFVPVIGLDIHIVLLFGFPIPLPHPYIGFVIDPMDYIPFIGATTKVNHVPRGVSDTSGILIIFIHFPMGGPWLLAPLIGHDSVNFFGSKKVKTEGRLMSPAGHMLMTCNDIGIPLSLRPGKKLKPLPSMYLPTSFSIPLSFGKPVNVGGPYVPDWAGVLINLVASFGFGALMKGLGKVVKKFNHALQKTIGSNKLSDFLCKKGLEPVDLVQGIVIYDGSDFELPGPIPLKWSRSWNSDSPHKGVLGHGMHLCYDMRVQEFVQEGFTLVLLGDGRSAVFDYTPSGIPGVYNRHEQLTLTRTDIDGYLLYHQTEKRYYTFQKLHPTDRQYRLTSIYDKAGFIITLHYNQSGHLLRITDSAGRQLHIQNDKSGRIVRVTAHHRGQERLMVSYAYNEAGDLSDIIDANGKAIRMSYHDHLMIQREDRNGQSFYWEYDRQRRCIHAWGENGVMEGYIEYHPEKGYSVLTNSFGQQTTYYYSPDFVVHQIKDALGHSTFTEYTEHFEIFRHIDEEGNATGYSYDEWGNCTAVTRADGATQSFSYDEDGNLQLVKDAQGNTRSYVYNEDNGNLHTITEPDGSLVMFTYDQQQLLRKVERLRAGNTLLEYDEDGNLTTATLPNGGRYGWQYDVWGQCIKSDHPQQEAQYFQYDILGRVTDIRTPDGNHIQLRYNAYDEVIHAKDKHHDIRFTYTQMGSLQSREENGAKVHFIHDTEERLVAVVNEHGESYRFKRDQRGQVIEETGFDNASRYLDRDAAGNVIRVRRPGKRSTLYEYDYSYRPTRAEHSDGSWETFTYDRNGRLIEAINEHNTLRFERDVLGNIVKEWQNGHEINTTFNKYGKRLRVTSSLGADIRYERNFNGAVTGITAAAGEIDTPWSAQISRDLHGLETARFLPGGIVDKRTYDDAGLPAHHGISHHARTLRSRYYRWDANQQLRQIVNALSKGVTTYSHDSFGYLTRAQYEDGQYDYRLPDKAGNLYKTPERKDRKFSAGGQLKESAQGRFEYDEEGNLIKKVARDGKIWEYEWYGGGMLKKVIRPDKQQVSFEYDALGRRTAKIYKQQITRWVWDGNTPLHEWHYPVKQRPVTTIDEDGNISIPPEPVPRETLTTWAFEADAAIPAARISGGKTYSVVADHLGTPCEAYDEEGNNIWSCELDIYGNVRKLAGDRNFVPFRYQGQYEDAETGLYYNRFRYYSPEEGSYISCDPTGLFGGINLYAYVKRPDAYVDIFGLNEIEWVDPKSLNFSQGYVGHQVEDYAQIMRDNKWEWSKSPLEVAEIDGHRVSLDNRRLLAAQMAEVPQVPIRIVNLDDPRPDGGTYRSNLEKKLNSKPKKRPDLQKVDLRPHGSPDKPKIVYPNK